MGQEAPPVRMDDSVKRPLRSDQEAQDRMDDDEESSPSRLSVQQKIQKLETP